MVEVYTSNVVCGPWAVDVVTVNLFSGDVAPWQTWVYLTHLKNALAA